MTASMNDGLECCPSAAWLRTEDLGHAEGVEFALGRCSVCGRYWLHLWTTYSRGPRYSALDERTAREFMESAPGPGRKRRLAQWLNA